MFNFFRSKKNSAPQLDEAEEYNYCPKCNDEYLAHVTTCAACNVPLISGKAKVAVQQERSNFLASRKGELTPDDDIVAIHQGKLPDVKHVQGLLKRENIGSLVAGDEQSCGKGCCGGGSVMLQVRRDDAQAAMLILQKEHIRTTGLSGTDLTHAEAIFNADAAQAVCPACGASFSTENPICPECGLCF